MIRAAFRLGLLLVIALLMLATAVRCQDETVAVDGRRADVVLLEGIWTGGYASEATGRHGTLTFEFAPGASHAVAQLVMVPRATPDAPAPEPVVLALHLVEVDSVTVRGALAPYDDPEWALGLETHFVGTIAGDCIEGTFDTLPTTIDTIPTHGRWWALRQRPASTDL